MSRFNDEISLEGIKIENDQILGTGSLRASHRPLARDVIQSLGHISISTTPNIPMDFTTDEPGQETSQKKTAATFFNPNEDMFSEDIQFIQAVASGKRKEAKILLEKTHTLALSRFVIIDLADRRFSGITAFQYALWALDWRMYNMIANYLSDNAVQQQAQQQEAITQACGCNAHYSFGEFNQHMRSAQKKIPVHIREAIPNTHHPYETRGIRRSNGMPFLDANIKASREDFNLVLFYNQLIEQRMKAFSCWSLTASTTRQQRTDEFKPSSSASFFKPGTRIPRENFNSKNPQETLLHGSPSVPRYVKRTSLY